MLTILDVNDRWHALADDARRYQAEKLEFMSSQGEVVRYVVIQPDSGTWTHTHGRAVVEHVGSEHGLISGRRLRELVQLHRPDVIECGSPALLPLLVQIASARLSRRPALLGYWHGERVSAQLGPRLAMVDPRLARAGAQLASWWTKQGYAGLDAVLVPSRDEARMLGANGLERVYLTPLGVDLERFTPAAGEPELVERLRAGVDRRAIVWTDADVATIAPIYAELCRRSSHDPALILAGGEDLEARERFAAAREHVHAPAIGDAEARARWLAAADVACVSGAVAGAEAMACAKPIVARAGTRAGELAQEAGCGWRVRGRDPVAHAMATVALVAAPDRDALGLRGRAWIARFDWASSFERILAVYAEVLDHVRHGRRVPAGVHEPAQPAALV